MLQKHLPDTRDLRVPPIPPKFEGPGIAVNSDGIDILHNAAVAHEPHPLRIHRAARAQHCFLPPLARPVRGAAHHLTKDQPLRIKRRVPFQWILRLIPELDPFEEIAETRDKHVQEVGIFFRIPWWRALARRDSETRRRIVKTGQNREFPRQFRQEPVIPFLSALVMPISPRYAGAQLGYADRL